MTKIMTFVSTLVSTVLIASFAQASILQLKPGSKEIKGVKIADSATLSLKDQALPLEIIGAGLRTKIGFSVYVAQLLSSDASKFVRTNEQALSSLNESRSLAMSLSFVRNVSAGEIQKAFRDALMKNDVKLDESAIAQFLDAVKNGGDANKNTSMIIASNKLADGSELVVYEDSNGKATEISATAGTTMNLMKIWLGESADGGLESLKKDIINYSK